MSAADEPPFVAGRPLVRAALAWAAHRHQGQNRAVDDAPLILHPAEVAALLSSRGLDEEVIAAGLLHATASPRRWRSGRRSAALVSRVAPSSRARRGGSAG